MKQKKLTNFSFAQEARRKQEIEQYGRILSLRPSSVHKSKKDYNRQKMKKETSQYFDVSFFYYLITLLYLFDIHNYILLHYDTYLVHFSMLHRQPYLKFYFV